MKHSFPYTNFHDLNLDWIISKMKEWGGLIEQKITEINKAVLTANTASARAMAAEASATAAQKSASASASKATAAEASATAAQKSASASASKATAAEASATAAQKSASASASKATAAEASATEARESASASASKATAAAASAKAAQEAAEEAAEYAGRYNIEDYETLTGIRYGPKDVYVKKIYLGYHLDVDEDVFEIPYTGVDAFLKIDILREEPLSAFTGLWPANITPSRSDANGLIVNVGEGVTEGAYYAIIYYTKA